MRTLYSSQATTRVTHSIARLAAKALALHGQPQLTSQSSSTRRRRRVSIVTAKTGRRKREDQFMSTRKRFILAGGTLTAVALAALIFGNRPAVRAAEGDQVEYTFGRPVEKGEQTYDWYRKTHADEAAKRYGVDPNAVGDGMDTWHWWGGVDNP